MPGVLQANKDALTPHDARLWRGHEANSDSSYTAKHRYCAHGDVVFNRGGERARELLKGRAKNSWLCTTVARTGSVMIAQFWLPKSSGWPSEMEGSNRNLK
ncbi:RING-type domain-containing protein [Psidium guajava]|nr:RING-type domain-containing protein [Psidium guajava]